MQRKKVLILTNWALALAIFLFLYRPFFSNLIPLLGINPLLHRLLPLVSAPLLIFTLFLRLWFRTPEKGLLFVARFIPPLLMILLLFLLLFPFFFPWTMFHLIEHPFLIISLSFLLLLSLIFLSFVSPTLREFKKTRRASLVISGWLTFLALMAFFFIAGLREIRLTCASFGLLVSLSALFAFLSGKERAFKIKSLTVAGALLLLALIFYSHARERSMDEYVRIFENSTNPEWRGHALDQIARRLPSKESIPFLMKALEDEEYTIRLRALTATGFLNRHRDKSGMVVLIAGIKHEDPYTRGMAAGLLGQHGGEEAVPLLIELLKGDENEFTRENAASGLGLTGHKSAIPALIEALKDKKPQVREAAKRALEQIASKST